MKKLLFIIFIVALLSGCRETTKITILTIVKFDQEFTVYHKAIGPQKSNMALICIIDYSPLASNVPVTLFTTQPVSQEDEQQLISLIGKTISYRDLEKLDLKF
jgi:hypothetical protein